MFPEAIWIGLNGLFDWRLGEIFAGILSPWQEMAGTKNFRI